MNFQNDITEQYLVKVYDDLQQYQMRLMNDIKTTNEMENEKKQNALTKQITLINSINMNIIRLRNLKKKSIQFIQQPEGLTKLNMSIIKGGAGYFSADCGKHHNSVQAAHELLMSVI